MTGQVADVNNPRFVIPGADWADHLQRAVRHAPRFCDSVVIVVASEPMRELGERAAARIGRTDLTFEVQE